MSAFVNLDQKDTQNDFCLAYKKTGDSIIIILIIMGGNYICGQKFFPSVAKQCLRRKNTLCARCLGIEHASAASDENPAASLGEPSSASVYQASPPQGINSLCAGSTAPPQSL